VRLRARLLGAWALLIGLADRCERAWRKRKRRANEWVLWLCGELIGSPVPSTWLREREVGRVLLIDATCIRPVGGTGDDWRLHTAYDLCAGRLSQVSITDRRGGEKFAYDVLQSGEIVGADRCYGFRSSVAYASKGNAYVVLRFVLRNFPVETEHGEALDLLAWAQHSTAEVASRLCWSVWQGERTQVPGAGDHPAAVGGGGYQSRRATAPDCLGVTGARSEPDPSAVGAGLC
jgi:hypothetical protein